MRIKIGSGLLYFVCFSALLVSLVYLFTPGLLPYHQAFLGKSLSELDSKVGILIMQAIRIVGGLTLTLGMVLFILIINFQKKRENWIWFAMFVLILISLSSLMIAMIHVSLQTPWWGIAILLLMALIGLFLIRNTERIE